MLQLEEMRVLDRNFGLRDFAMGNERGLLLYHCSGGNGGRSMTLIVSVACRCSTMTAMVVG